MKIFVVGLLVCFITGTGALQMDDAERPDGVQEDPISPVSWINLFSKLDAFMHAKKDPDIGVTSIPDKQLDDDAVDDDGFDTGTTVIYENVTVTEIINEGGETKSVNHSEAVSPASSLTNKTIDKEGSNDSAAKVSVSTGTAPPMTKNNIKPTPLFLNPNLSVKEAIALFKVWNQSQQNAEDGQKQEHRNSTDHTVTTAGQPDEEAVSLLPGETMHTQINGTDGYDRVDELEGLIESQSNFIQLSLNSSLSNYTVPNQNESQTDAPGVDITSSPLADQPASLADLGQTANKTGNATVLDTMSPASGNTTSLPTISHNPLDMEVDDMRFHTSPDYGVVEASTDSTSTQLPRQFWIANDKGDDDDSDSKENNFTEDMVTSSSTSSPVYEGEIERLSDVTTPRCDWMGSNNSNAFITMIDRLCHTLKPLPIILNVLIFLTLGIISVVVCRIACLCIQRRRRKKHGEDKDSLLEAGSRKEKKSLLQV